jgi:hypothetical protein
LSAAAGGPPDAGGAAAGADAGAAAGAGAAVSARVVALAANEITTTPRARYAPREKPVRNDVMS